MPEAVGAYAGTYPFMPKEQITNYKYANPVLDVFSIGATFYNMLTGKYVYDILPGKDHIKTILEGKVIHIRSRKRDIPEGIASVIDKSISPETKDRYRTAGEMKKELEKAVK